MEKVHNSRFQRFCNSCVLKFGIVACTMRFKHLFVVAAFVFGLIFIYISSFSSHKPSIMNTESRMVSLKELLAVSVEMAKRGGLEVKRIRERANNIGEKSKGETAEGANIPVTDGDILSHRQMFYGFKKAFPSVTVISEEEDNKEETKLSDISDVSFHNAEIDRVIPYTTDFLVDESSVTVWIDPLDATQEYTENILHFVTTMVCVAVNGKPTLGVIHKPFVADENNHSTTTTWAFAGGHLKNLQSFVSPNFHQDKLKKFDKTEEDTDMSSSKIIVSRSHAGKVEDVAVKALGDKVVITPAGGAGYKAWEVANGTQDAYIHVTNIKKWDICAGAVLLNALGGSMTALDGSLIDYSAGNVENKGGVLATMHDHELYVNKLKAVRDL